MQRSEKIGGSYKKLHNTSQAFLLLSMLLAPTVINLSLNGVKKYEDLFKLVFAFVLFKSLIDFVKDDFDMRTEQQLRAAADRRPEIANHSFYFFNNKSELRRTFANIGFNGVCFSAGAYALLADILSKNPSNNYLLLAAYVVLMKVGFKGFCTDADRNFDTQVEHYQRAAP